jgi:hypothetical protein
VRLAVLLALFLALLAAGLPSHGAQAGAPGADGATELALEVGELRIVTPGPVRQLLCDRGGVVEVASSEQGNGFRAVAAGETICSLVTADGVRRVYRVKVSRRPDAPSRPGS